MFEQPRATPVSIKRGATPASTFDQPIQHHRDVTQRIDSGRLLAGSNELVIEHAGQEYRLRLTRNDKLILTK